MIHPSLFYQCLHEEGVDFFAGVPDSLLKHFCTFIRQNVSGSNNIITQNEGGAVALAAGHYLATHGDYFRFLWDICEKKAFLIGAVRAVSMPGGSKDSTA